MASGGLRQNVTRAENVHVGTDREPYFDIFDADGDSVDVSGFTALDFLLSYSGGSLAKALGTGVAVEDGPATNATDSVTPDTNNRVRVTIADTDWAALDPSARYTFRLDGTDAAGAKDVLAWGDWEFVG